jgi:hypothetical protein
MNPLPSQARDQFRIPRRCSYPEGCGCYCMTRTQRCVPVGPPHQKARPERAGRERDAVQRGAGESGKARKTSSLGGAQKRITQLQIESNLRGKRSDPFHGANARPQAGAVLVARWWCEMRRCRRANTRPASYPSADGTEPGEEASLDRFRR